MAIIETKELEFDYVTRDEEANVTEVDRAIDGVSLQIEAGSFVAVLGHNGSGKSTLAKTLNGILLPSGGTVLISGMDTADDANLLNIRTTRLSRISSRTMWASAPRISVCRPKKSGRGSMPH